MMLPNPFRFLGAVFRTAWAKLRGYEILADGPERTKRQCCCRRLCSHYLKESDQCAVCSCFVFAKTMLAVERCPVGWWRPVWKKKKKSALTKTGQISTS